MCQVMPTIIKSLESLQNTEEYEEEEITTHNVDHSEASLVTIEYIMLEQNHGGATRMQTRSRKAQKAIVQVSCKTTEA